jgi:hypothetical protein
MDRIVITDWLTRIAREALGAENPVEAVVAALRTSYMKGRQRERRAMLVELDRALLGVQAGIQECADRARFADDTPEGC